MDIGKKNFQIGKRNNETQVKMANVAESFVSGRPRETTKTFRIPEELAFSLKKYAVETRQTEKDILISLISAHLKNAGAI